MAYGTESVAKVDKIFGPGNAFVTEAKRQVSNDFRGAAIDMPAGPSEVLVIADSSADPDFIAADLLSQAEHGPDSQVVLVTPDPSIADRTADAIQQQLKALPRADIARQALTSTRRPKKAGAPTARSNWPETPIPRNHGAHSNPTSAAPNRPANTSIRWDFTALCRPISSTANGCHTPTTW